jgi:hypothetical protein
VKNLLVFFLLLFMLPAFAGTPDAPEPKPVAKHEVLKFSAAAAYWGGATTLQIIAQRHGAALCRGEVQRAGEPALWGTSPSYGLYPRDKLVAEIGGGVLAGSTILELTGHKKAAKRILIYGGTLFYGIGGATYWAGCN